MSVRCKLLGHRWPRSIEMPAVPSSDPIVIRCKRCRKSEVVHGWLREAFAYLEGEKEKLW